MDQIYMECFVKAAENIFSQFGIFNIKKGNIYTKDSLIIENDTVAFIGIIGDVRGNVAYSFSNKTALSIASTMMMGMPVEKIDDMCRSAIAEMANMLTGNAVISLSNENTNIDITPPSVLDGKYIYGTLSTIKSSSISLETPIGNIDISIAIEN